MDFTPIFKTYQLLGDSNMVRFSRYILDFETKRNEQGLSTAGPFCISGQGIRELIKCTSSCEWDLLDNIIVCIGTNDVKRMLPVKDYKIAVYALIGILKNRKIIWMTVPPILRYKNSQRHLAMLDRYNSIIKELNETFPNITVIDSHLIFVENGNIREDLFTRYYIRPKSQQHLEPLPDDVHFNEKGFCEIKDLLNKTISKIEEDHRRWQDAVFSNPATYSYSEFASWDY